MTKTKTRTKTVHKCTTCGEETARWAGRCPGCGDWNTLTEVAPLPEAGNKPVRRVTATPLKGAAADPKAPLATGLDELDRVLGGGIVRGSVSLLGGEPGIGKSTLILQLCAAVATKGGRCLIATGEESVEQVGRRAARLSADLDSIMLVAESDVDVILAVAAEIRPDLLIVDSVQTMVTATSASSAGTAAQVRESAAAFTAYAKEHDVAMVLVGHVTKEGSLAGPRVLEHLVDTVIEFEGDRHHGLRFLRTVKHRFGATDEVGVLEMTAGGLTSVVDASALFLDDRQKGSSGSTVVPTLQGRRPLLVEIQALVNDGGEISRRVAQGVDFNRFNVIVAILEKHTGVRFIKKDIYVSIVGGLRVEDPGTDLALALTLASSKENAAVPDDLVAIGELGLNGEVRKATHLQRRLVEASRMGFKRAIVPQATPEQSAGIELLRVATINEALGITMRQRVRAVS